MFGRLKESDTMAGVMEVCTPLKAINNKVIIANEAEIERNPRARSAKLRIAEIK